MDFGENVELLYIRIGPLHILQFLTFAKQNLRLLKNTIQTTHGVSHSVKKTNFKPDLH